MDDGANESDDAQPNGDAGNSDTIPNYNRFNNDFEFGTMFDNIDDMDFDIDINDAVYQKAVTDSLTLQAIKDTTKKLESLRREFYQEDTKGKLQTIKDATSNIKDKVKELF